MKAQSRRIAACVAMLSLALALYAADNANFSGTWSLNVEKSRVLTRVIRETLPETGNKSWTEIYDRK